MKKIAVAFALLLAGLVATTTATAQNMGPGGFGPGNGPGSGPMFGGGFGNQGSGWAEGSSITREYKKATGTLLVGQTLVPLFQADGVKYVLMLPGYARFELADLKNGDTVTFEGIAMIIKSANEPTRYIFHPFQAVVNGKTIPLGGQYGFGPRHHRGFGPGEGRGPGMMGGYSMGGYGWGGNGPGPQER